jgi:hypothetical protein
MFYSSLERIQKPYRISFSLGGVSQIARGCDSHAQGEPWEERQGSVECGDALYEL